MSARPTSRNRSVKTFDSVRAALQERYAALVSTGARGGWRAVAAEYGISAAMAQLIAVKGHEPKDPTIRAALGLSRYALAQVCATCGEVHTTRYCTKQRKQVAEQKPRVRWKRHYRALVCFLAFDAQRRAAHARARQIAIESAGRELARQAFDNLQVTP